MTLEIFHPFENEKPDGGDTTIVRPSDWNANHPIRMSPGVIGRTDSGDGLATVLPYGSGASGDVVLSSQIREKLIDDRNYFVRVNLGIVTLTIASPAVAFRNSHDLVAGDAVVFSLPYDCPEDHVNGITITIATPGVVSFPGHGYSNNDPVRLWTTGALPTGLTPNTILYARNVATDTMELSLTSGGASIATSGSQSGTHKIERASHLPTGVEAGVPYYVIATGLASDNFQFSATPGGAAINTSGTQAGKILLATGNDDNNGLAQTRAGAFLTIKAAVEAALLLDLNNHVASIQLAHGLYLAETTGDWINRCVHIEGQSVSPGLPSDRLATGNGKIFITGDEDHRNKCVLSNRNGEHWWSPVNVAYQNCVVHFRQFTIEQMKNGSVVTVEGGTPANATYVDHINHRGIDGEGGTFVYGSGYAQVWVHGLCEVFCAPQSAYFWAYKNSVIYNVAGGNAYRKGLIAYVPQNYDTGLIVSELWSRVHVGVSISFEGSFAGPSYTLKGGSTLHHEKYDTYYGEDLPGDAPIVESGSRYTEYDVDEVGSYRSKLAENEVHILGNISGDITLKGAEDSGTWTLELPDTAGIPGQTLETDGTGVTFWGGRAPLTANTTFYIDADDGVDDPDGGTIGAPWETPQYAYDYVASNYDLAGFRATFQLVDATAPYTAMNGTRPLNPSEASTVYWRGNPTTPANVKWEQAVEQSPLLRLAVETVRIVTWVNGFTFSNDAESILDATNGFGNIKMGDPDSVDPANIVVTLVPDNSFIFEGTVQLVSGEVTMDWTGQTTTPYSLFDSGAASTTCVIGGTITIVDTPEFTGGLLTGDGFFLILFATITGAFTGKQYSATAIRKIGGSTDRQDIAPDASEDGDMNGGGTFLVSGTEATRWSILGTFADKTQTVSPSTGATLTMVNDQGTLVINGGGTLAALTINMKPNPYDNEIVNILANVAVTAVTWGGGTFAGAPAGLAIGMKTLRYNLGADTWYGSV